MKWKQPSSYAWKLYILGSKLLPAANSKGNGLKRKIHEFKSNNEIKQVFSKWQFKGRFHPGKLWNSWRETYGCRKPHALAVNPSLFPWEIPTTPCCRRTRVPLLCRQSRSPLIYKTRGCTGRNRCTHNSFSDYFHYLNIWNQSNYPPEYGLSTARKDFLEYSTADQRNCIVLNPQ